MIVRLLLLAALPACLGARLAVVAARFEEGCLLDLLVEQDRVGAEVEEVVFGLIHFNVFDFLNCKKKSRMLN